MEVSNWIQSYAYTCQRCQRMYESSVEFENLTPYVSPICNLCLLSLIKKNGHSIKKSLRDKGQIWGYKDFPDLYKLFLSSVNRKVKGQKGYLLDFDLAPDYVKVFKGQKVKVNSFLRINPLTLTLTLGGVR